MGAVVVMGAAVITGIAVGAVVVYVTGVEYTGSLCIGALNVGNVAILG